MKNMRFLCILFLISSIALDISRSIFARNGSDIPSLQFLGWGCFILSLICLVFVSDDNHSNTTSNHQQGSHIKDKD